MKCNAGKGDRIFRVIVGIVIIAAGLFYSSWWGAVGIIPLFTAAIGWCPLYLPLGLSTCKVDDKSAK